MAEDKKDEVAINPNDCSPENIKAIQKHNAKIHKFIASMQEKIEEKKSEFIPEPQPRPMTLAECNEATRKAKIGEKVAPAMAMQQVKIKPVVPQQIESPQQ